MDGREGMINGVKPHCNTCNMGVTPPALLNGWSLRQLAWKRNDKLCHIPWVFNHDIDSARRDHARGLHPVRTRQPILAELPIHRGDHGSPSITAHWSLIPSG